jgi:hypothetical protein
VTSDRNTPLDNVTVSFSVTSGEGSLSATQAKTNGDGEASTTWTLGNRAGVGTVTAVVASLPPVTFSADVRPGPASVLRFRTPPGGALVGAPFATQPVLEVQDRHGNLVTEATIRITASVASGEAGLTGGVTVMASGGVATFADLGLKGRIGPQMLRFSASEVAEPLWAPVTLEAERALTDRPDEVSGAQVHVVYVLPSDGVDRRLDTNATLSNSVGSFQRWLAGKTGLAFKMDTYMDGALDITFFRLGRSDAEIKTFGALVRDEIERELKAAGLLQPEKLYAVYYEGGSTYACGGASWPPSVPGQLMAMYLKGSPGGVSCERGFVSSADDFPGYWEFAALHDLIHTLGVVSSEAPHHTADRPGHVPEPRDLMYGGAAPWELGVRTEVDLGGDDYHGAAVPDGVARLLGNPFLVSAPGLAPRGWRAESIPRRLSPEAAVPVLPPHPPFEPRARER